ncbi:MAG: hypothetical protein RBT64_11335 [Trichloromonas sp.]|jgi:hypothetical protein|nr:hypothetical protein [Trichloromonas sp.]
MNTTILFSVGGFILILAALVLLRAKNARFEVKPSDIVVAVVPVVLFLLVTGKLQKLEVGEGGVKIETAFVQASASTIDKQVAPLAGIAAEPIQLNPKMAVGEIPRLLESETEGLTFRLGHGGYWGPAIVEYFAALSRQPFLKYVIIEQADGRFFGLANARALAEFFQQGYGSPFSAGQFAEWLNTSDTKVLAQLPGFIGAADAVSKGTDKYQALLKMETLAADRLPATNEAGRFAGMVERSRLTASLLIDVAKNLNK